MTPKARGPLCPQCDKPCTGNFCQHCGATLGGRFCNECGGKVAAGAAFCNQCGQKVAGGGTGGSGHRAAAVAVVGGQNLPWWIAGASMFVLIFIVGLQMVRPAGPAAPEGNPAAGAVGGGAGAAAIDLTQMTPIEAAGRLFNRVMQSASSGDSTEAQAFLPMAIAAYQRARPLDLDGLFHLSLLNRTAMNLEAALANALEIIEQDPNHLLGLAAAAEAAVELGSMDEAEKHYRRVMEIYDGERGRSLDEYGQHVPTIDAVKSDAEAFLASR